MRFKTDENLHPDVAAFLRELGHDAVTVWDQASEAHRIQGLLRLAAPKTVRS